MMTSKKSEEEFNPWPAYFLIGSGAILIGLRFFNDNDTWSGLEIVKLGAGVVSVGIGVYKLVKKV